MFYWLTILSDGGDFFNLFRYITFRAGGAFMTSLIFGFVFGRPLINLLRRRQGRGQPIRTDGPEGHFSKAGTPTMGGALILGALVVSTLLWARLDNMHIWVVLFVTVGFGAIGFADDYAKVTKQTVVGVSGKLRLGLGFVIALVASLVAAQLALKYDLPMIPAFGTRTGDGTQFDVEFDAAIRPSDSMTMTQDFNDNLSARIHANPDQWYWMLRRWKGA